MLKFIRLKLAQARLERITKARREEVVRKRHSTKLSATYQARRVREIRQAMLKFR